MAGTNLDARLCYLGGPGSGKTHQIIKELEKSGLSNTRTKLLLPTRGMIEHIKNISLTSISRDGIIEDIISTFGQWATTTLKRDETLVSVTEVLPLVRAILEEADLPCFNNVSRLPGFPAKITKSIFEIMDNGLTPSDILKGAKGNKKLKSMAKVMTLLQEGMRKLSFVSSGELLFRLRKNIKENRVDIPESILFDGFYDFTKGQRRCFEALLEKGINITITLPVMEKEVVRPIFQNPKRTYDLLVKHGFKFKTLSKTPDPHPSSPRRIFHRLFTDDKRAAPLDGFALLTTDTVENLIQTMALRIRKSKAEGKLPLWRNVGIVARDLSPYELIIRRIFDQYKIPHHIHHNINPGKLSFGQNLLFLLEILGRTPPRTCFEKANYVNAIQDAFSFLAPKDILEEILFWQYHEIGKDGRTIKRKVFPQDLKSIRSHITGGKAKDHLEFILGIIKKCSDREINPDTFSEILTLILKRYSTEFFIKGGNQTRGLKDGAMALKGFFMAAKYFKENWETLDLPLNTWESCRLRFKEFLDSQKIPMDSKLKDAVHIVDVYESRTWVWEEVYLIGLNQNEFPKRAREDIFFKDMERQTIDFFLPTAKSARFEEELLFVFASSRSKGTTVFSRHTIDNEGRELQPSHFLEEINSIFEPPLSRIQPLVSLTRPTIPSSNWTQKSNGKSAACFSLGRIKHFNECQIKANIEGRILFDHRKSELSLQDNPANWLSVREKAPETLPDDFLPMIKKAVEPFSVSSLNDFIACPFKSFAKKLLKLSPLIKGPVLDNLLLGKIAHETLSRYFSTTDKSFKKSYFHRIFTAVRDQKLAGSGMAFDELDFDQEQELMRLEGALGILVERENQKWLNETKAVPSLFEWKFGARDSPVNLLHNNRTEPFSGRIDRVDFIDGKTALVIDYKLSSGEIKKKDLAFLEKGLLPQLPIYCLAASRLLKKEVAGGLIERVKKVDRSGFINKDAVDDFVADGFKEQKLHLFSEEEFEAMGKSAMDNIFDFCELAKQGHCEINPRDSEESCSFIKCDFFDFCRVGFK